MKKKVNIFNFIFFIFTWVILFLLHRYIGDIYSYFFRFINIFFLVDIFQLILSIYNIYYTQKFSTEHPVKGEIIKYRLVIENRLPFEPCFIKIYFNKSLNISDLSFNSINKEPLIIETTFSLPYRGVYNVGLKDIIFSDFLKIFSISINSWPRTFYVYPKIVKIGEITTDGFGQDKKNSIIDKNMNLSNLESISKYTPGISMSYISWKHFAIFNEPYIKKFTSSTFSDCNIFLDNTNIAYPKNGPVDDLAIEIFVSIVSNNVNNNIISYTNHSIKKIDTKSKFDLLYKDSVFIKFDQEKQSVINDFISLEYSAETHLIIITAFQNEQIFNFEMLSKYKYLTIYIITKNMKECEKERLSKLLKIMPKEVKIICLN